jgi:hypothetical protein
MDMNICHDCEAPPRACIPKGAEVPSVEPDNSAIETTRVKVIVKNEIDNASVYPVASAQEKRTAFSTVLAAAFAELFYQPPP